MRFSEKWGKDIKTATDLALKDLKASIDEVKVTVLEEPSKGFLGIGSKLALVRVELIEKAEAVVEEIKEVFVSDEKAATEEVIVEDDPRKEAEAKIEELSNKFAELRQEAKEINQEETAEESVIYDGRTLSIIEEHKALEFLKETSSKMGIELNFVAYGDEENLLIKISGKNSGTIIGKRGQTLDAIQYLTSLVVNKDKENYVRVILDAENYRFKRENTLKALAVRLADKVSRTKKSVKLEPMNPYERMVIHSALQGHEKVVTRSEGEEPYRRIVIELKR